MNMENEYPHFADAEGNMIDALANPDSLQEPEQEYPYVEGVGPIAPEGAALVGKKDPMSLDFTPEVTQEDIAAALEKTKESYGYDTPDQYRAGFN